MSLRAGAKSEAAVVAGLPVDGTAERDLRDLRDYVSSSLHPSEHPAPALENYWPDLGSRDWKVLR